MSAAIETHRSMVKAWECDSFGHFTVAYYFDRFADASATARERFPTPEGWAPTEYLARFISELRAGEVFHIESGVIAVADAALRIGHRLVNSATAEVYTTIEEHLQARPRSPALSAAGRAALEERSMAWETSKEDPGFADGAAEGWMASARDRVRPAELDATGQLGLPGYIHRSSIGCIQLLTAMGLSPDYLREFRRGFSTFEIKLRLDGPGSVAGDALVVTSGLMQLGMSSMRMIHRVSDARSGRRVATLRQAGVHFDLEARRSTAIPDDLRAKAASHVLRGS
ncbi:MAG TPA: thioesterase family protein [Stellaceae bacterium]|nr:thioesterase family protein [Stellaceae bacterium]